MAQQILSDVRNKLTADQAVKTISNAYKSIVGRNPTKRVLTLLVGQSALETDSWKSLPNYNFGGVKASAKDAYAQWLKTWERDANGQRYDTLALFAAYRTAEAGAKAWIETIKRRDYWWKALHSGDPDKYVYQLAGAPTKEGKRTKPAYMTATQKEYLFALNKRSSPLSKEISKYAGVGVAGVVGLILTGVAGWFAAKHYMKG